jgi:septal ring factor EnvC (AmiA/AmiB activator)
LSAPHVGKDSRVPGIMRGAVTLASALALLAVSAPPAVAEPDPDRLEEIQQEIEASHERLEAASTLW